MRYRLQAMFVVGSLMVVFIGSLLYSQGQIDGIKHVCGDEEIKVIQTEKGYRACCYPTLCDKIEQDEQMRKWSTTLPI